MDMTTGKISRRRFVACCSAVAGTALGGNSLLTSGWRTAGLLAGGSADAATQVAEPLAEFEYGEVALQSELHNRQREEAIAVLMGLSEDSLLNHFRKMSGQPAPGEDWAAGIYTIRISTGDRWDRGLLRRPRLGSGFGAGARVRDQP